MLFGRFGEWNFRRRRDAEQFGRERDRHALRRRLIVGHVEHAVGAARERRVDRLRDVGDVDAVEHLARLVDALRAAARDLHQRVLAGAVNPREPQDRDRLAGARAERAPCLLGGEPLAAALRDRRGGRRLVDPCAAVVAVDADGREIDDRFAAAARPRSSRRNARSTGSPLSPGGTETSIAAASISGGGDLRRCVAAVEHERLDLVSADARARDRRRLLARASPCRRCDRTARRIPRCNARPNSRGRSRTALAILRRDPFVPHGFVGLARALLLRQRCEAAAGSSRPSAQTAAPRTSGEASSSSRSASAASATSPRVADRDQHIAHEAVAPGALDRRFGKQRAERRIVEPRQLGELRRAQGLARRELRLAPGLRELVPRTHRETIVAAVDAVAHQRRAARAGSGPCARSSDTKCSAAHRAGRAPETRWSGRHRGRPGTCRSDRSRLRRAASSSVVKIAPRNSHEPCWRDTRLVCLPCQPSPALAASGFSITAAVSTNTFTSPPAFATSQRAIALSRDLIRS